MNHMCTLYGTVKAMLYEWEILLDLPGAAEAVYDMEVKYKQQMEQYEPYRVCRRLFYLS